MGLEDLSQFIKPKNEKFNKNNKNSNQPKTQQNQPKKEDKPKPLKPNIGWLFYKDYFKDLKYDSSDEDIINRRVLHIISQSTGKRQPNKLGNVSFELSTTYPGLLIGSGTTHKLPKNDGQAYLGFHFDYTSGLPEIPASSIKGVLRSAFEHPEYIKEILDNQNIDVKKLENEIFGQDHNANSVSMGKDIFFDATIVKGDKKNKILGDDFITPHKEAIKNPIPLRFIKVLPEVKFCFDFLLTNGVLSIDQKVKLFKQIILDFGLGAKTNVGYGKFIEA